MSIAVTSRALPLGTLLRLGRVSNLPTVWTDVLAGTALAGGDPLSGRTALALAAMTLFYIGGMFHKGNPLSPVVMSLCRLLVYLGAAAAAVGSVPAPVWLAGTALAAHVVGLTYAAKQESLNRIDRLWPLAVLALPLGVALPGVLGAWWTALFWLALAA